MIVIILIIFFIFLVIYQFLEKKIEGLENSSTSTSTSAQPQTYGTNDPMILSQQNAANIQVLQGQVKDLSNLPSTVSDLSGNVANLSSQVKLIAQNQATSSVKNPQTKQTIANAVSGDSSSSTTNTSS